MDSSRKARPLGVRQTSFSRPDVGFSICFTSSSGGRVNSRRSDEHTSELKSLIRKSYAVFCLNKKKARLATILLNLSEDIFNNRRSFLTVPFVYTCTILSI